MCRAVPGLGVVTRHPAGGQTGLARAPRAGHHGAVIPERPRLASHVRPRRHVVDGDERFVLHDGREAVAQLGLREWVLLCQADGTRDVEGLRLAALREGVRVSRADLEAFVGALASAGLVEEGAPRALEVARAAAPAPPAATADSSASSAPSPRPVRALPGFRLACDGRGTCCRFYGTVLFSPLEVARARALLPLVDDAGDRPERAFLPERGGAPTGGRAVSLVNGRCSYLEPEGACALHAAGGPLAKPLGCRTFPASLVDVGHELRVSVAFECACVEASAGGDHGEPLVPSSVVSERDLDAALRVAEVPLELELGGGRRACRELAGAWLDALGERAPCDLVALLWGAADALERGGLERVPEPRAPEPRELSPWLEALARRADERARGERRYRSSEDLVPLVLAWVAAGARALVGAPLGGAGDAEAAERLYLEAMVFGRAPLQEPVPLDVALRARAARVALSRALRAAPKPSHDRAFTAPLALVEAACRGHALASFAVEAAGAGSRDQALAGAS